MNERCEIKMFTVLKYLLEINLKTKRGTWGLRLLHIPFSGDCLLILNY